MPGLSKGKGNVKISARVENSYGEHHVTLTTNDNSHSIGIPPKASGFGSSANGGELLLLALASCYCNDIYREAAKRGITVEDVAVAVEGDFGADGEPATNVVYHARVVAQAAESEIRELMQHTDTVAEIQNTLRVLTPIVLDQIEAVSVQT
jgi:organic hydroperoxide reductase OsmC/OhrA